MLIDIANNMSDFKTSFSKKVIYILPSFYISFLKNLKKEGFPNLYESKKEYQSLNILLV